MKGERRNDVSKQLLRLGECGYALGENDENFMKVADNQLVFVCLFVC